VAAYKVARDMGKSAADAASIAKNLTTNFNRKGEWGPALNLLYLFYNASIQGSVRTLQALTSSKVRYAMAGITGLTLGLALANADWGGEDDDGEKFWDKIPDYEKERNLILMLPPGAEMAGGEKVGTKGRYLKFPLPYGFNVFTVLGYNLADVGRGLKSNGNEGLTPAKGAMRVASAVLGSFNPFGGAIDFSKTDEVALALLPTMADVVYQLGNEVNSFGRPVAPKAFDETMPDSQRYNARQAGTVAQQVTDWAYRKTVSKPYVPTIDVTPGTIENVTRMAGGGLGQFIYDVGVNIPSKLYNSEDIAPREVPFWRNLQGEVDGALDVGRAYERSKQVKDNAAKVKRMTAMGIEVDFDNPESTSLRALEAAQKSFTKEMQKLRKEEISLMQGDLPDSEKRAERKRIQQAGKDAAQAFNTDYITVMRDKEQK
jgi:hypothetical protein